MLSRACQIDKEISKKDASCQLLIDTVLDNEQYPEIRVGLTDWRNTDEIVT
jgi:hypothetical protein